MKGGPSHIDTFDPKPSLDRLHMTVAPASARGDFGARRYVRSPFRFRRAGRLGIEINEGFEQFSEIVDEVCFYRGLQAESANHSVALAPLRGLASGDDAAAPQVDVERAPESTRRLYGVGDRNPELDAVARGCLAARLRVEWGARFAAVTVDGWDAHENIASDYSARIRAIDRPIAALIKDLQRTELLERTLVIWCGEFGRSPDNWIRHGASAWGRDHNARAMTAWLAGGGAVRGRIVGATDELGAAAVEAVHPMRDFVSTALCLLGQEAAAPIPELIA
ncbi:MAG: DUF1501 domain-containing protein [Bryobacteraceae bacterium]|nr:DUF1501 domain-containing protein [Bryobacteraceae bacterium]